MALDDALARLLASITPLPATPGGTQSIPTFEADGRVLAQTWYRPHRTPQDNSSMDGYAVRCADLLLASAGNPVTLPVAQRIAAGHAGQPLQPGTVARISPGAHARRADAVVMREDVRTALKPMAQAGGAQLPACHKPPSPPRPEVGGWVRRAGEDVSRGPKCCRPVRVWGPQPWALTASLGLDRLTVSRKPKVALFSTGDELVMPGTVPPTDATRRHLQLNRFFLRALLVRMGCGCPTWASCPTTGQPCRPLADAARHHDLILTSGGVSVGERPHQAAVQQLGSLDLWQIAMKPGKPFAMAGCATPDAMGRTDGGQIDPRRPRASSVCRAIRFPAS